MHISGRRRRREPAGIPLEGELDPMRLFDLERIGQEGVIYYAQKQTNHWADENPTD
jgi:hypothetical protein